MYEPFCSIQLMYLHLLVARRYVRLKRRPFQPRAHNSPTEEAFPGTWIWIETSSESGHSVAPRFGTKKGEVVVTWCQKAVGDKKAMRTRIMDTIFLAYARTAGIAIIIEYARQ